MIGGRILLERSIGETRAVAMDANGRAFSLYIERASDAGGRVRLGDVHAGHVRAAAPQQGAVFVELDSGVEVVVRPKADTQLAEGAAVMVKIAAEAHRGKLARADICDGKEDSHSNFDRWKASLPGGDTLVVDDVATGEAAVSAAFDDAIEANVFLSGGGRMTLSPTPALMAVDIDTAGRKDTGRAANRALNVNRIAAAALALEISLRRIGGLVVLDCLAPLNRDAGDKVRDAFMIAHTAIDPRAAKCLRPSSLGLMELSLERCEAPIRDILLGADGNPTAETVCLEALRRLAVEARSYPMAALTVRLPSAAKDWFDGCGQNLQESIDHTFGARISVVTSSHSQFEILSQ